ncbi:peptidase M14 carboxypeptidase A [Clostridium sp. CAG:967]|nr:peptidase M14 carboxypeptidase A [Clostridium sp. CAG:967]
MNKSAITKLKNKIELIGDYGKTLIVGVFHGDEPQGKFLIEEYLKNNDTNGLLFIPCLNPDGMQLKTRTNSNGVDLNRNFPTKNWELTKKNEFFGGMSAGSEIETKFLMDTINEFKPQLILTLHAPYKIVNYDGPAREISEKISEIIGYPVEESIGYPTPGSFGTYAGIEREIPAITLELDEVCPVQDLVKPVFEIFDMLKKRGL